jgi:hypothetical protein
MTPPIVDTIPVPEGECCFGLVGVRNRVNAHDKDIERIDHNIECESNRRQDDMKWFIGLLIVGMLNIALTAISLMGKAH